MSITQQNPQHILFADTSNLSNQEKVWLAEQKAQAEAQKVKELQTQIQLEREKEEFERLAGKKSKGDRGVDWMYEEGGGPAYEEDAKLEAAREEEKNEAYLLGKEYVPQGQEKHSGDFAVAATMGGVLEKASTRGATIGAGEGNAGGEVLRLKDSTAEHVMDEGRSEFNREFHLRHEDPMFAVHQKRERQRKEVEKKRNLMERAGLVVKEVKRGADGVADTEENNDDSKGRSKKRKKHHKHHHRERSFSSSSYSSSYSKERRHRKKREKKHKRHRHDRSRHERRRERSRSRSRDRSKDRSTDSIDKDSRHRRHKDRYHDKDECIDRRDSDRHSHHYHERKRDRSTSRERREERYNNERDRDSKQQHHEDDFKEDELDEFGRSRHHSSNRRKRDSWSHRDEDRDRRHERHSSRHEERHARKDHERRRSRSRSPCNDQRHHRDERKRADHHVEKEENPKPDHSSKKEGYGLIGTSLSDAGREKSSTNHDTKQPASLGPDSKLLAAKREEVERERQSRFNEARRRGGQNGCSREDRDRALEQMERNARNREYRHHG